MRAELEKRLNIKARDYLWPDRGDGPPYPWPVPGGRGHACAGGSFLPGDYRSGRTLKPLPDGQVGELVFSTISKEGVPLLRYRTGTSAPLTRGTCVVRPYHGAPNVPASWAAPTTCLSLSAASTYSPTQIESALLNLAWRPTS